MRNTINSLIFCLVSIGASFAQSEFKGVENDVSFHENMKQIANQTKSIQCDFIQEKQLSFMDQKMVSKGKLFFSGTDRLRWEYVEPYHYAVLMVSDQLVIIDEGEVNETKLGKNPAFKKVQQLLTSTLKGDFESQSEAFDQKLDENSTFYRMTLTPKDKSMLEFVSQMQVYFSKKDFMLTRFVMDENGDVTNTVFSEQKINAELPSDVFAW